jgi:hypothetical protein
MGIYAYWEGSNRHWYYDLCWQTVLRHNPDAKLLSRHDVEEIIGPLPEALNNVQITHRVDWIRKAYIGAAGGLWLDMDFVCLRPLARLEALAEDFDFVGWQEWPWDYSKTPRASLWMDNFFVGCYGSRLLQSAADYALEQAQNNGKRMSWLSASADAIDHAMREHPQSNWMQIPTHMISPVSVMNPKWFTGDNDGSDIYSYRAFGFMTSFTGICSWMKKTFRTADEFLASNSRIASIVRVGLHR